MSGVKTIVVTCDKYSKLIPGFCYFLERYWPVRTWPLQIVTGKEQPWLKGLENVWCYGEDRGWSSNVIRLLGAFSFDLIVLLLDDYYLSAPADDALLQQLVATMQKDESIGYINLRPWSDDVLDGRDWMEWQQVPKRPITGEYDKATAEYLLSLQPGIWRPDFLRKLLRHGEDGWRAETAGTIRARETELRMLGCIRPFTLPHVNVTRYGDYRDGSRAWLVGELGEEHKIVASLDGMLQQRIL